MKTAAFFSYRHQYFYGHPGDPDPDLPVSADVRLRSEEADAALTPQAWDYAYYPAAARLAPPDNTPLQPAPASALPTD